MDNRDEIQQSAVEIKAEVTLPPLPGAAKRDEGEGTPRGGARQRNVPASMPAARSIKSTVSQQDQNDVDDIKARTMYRMVDETENGTKLVFFNNRQARLFNADNVSTLLNALLMTSEYKTVIHLLPSIGGTHSLSCLSSHVKAAVAGERDEGYAERLREAMRLQFEQDPDFMLQDGAEYRTPIDVSGHVSFRTEEEARRAQFSLDTFCREVLVPFAAANRALVVGNPYSEDSLYMAFTRSADALKAKYRGNLPFATFGIIDAPGLAKATAGEDTTARELFDSCTAWRQRYSKVLEAMGKGEGGEGGELFGDMDGEFDVNPFVRNLLVVDCVGEDTEGNLELDHSPKDQLETLLMQHMVSSLPTISVGTMHHYDNKYEGESYEAIFNSCNMGIPVLLLDIRPKGLGAPYDPSLSKQQLFEEAQRRFSELEADLAQEGKADLLEICRLSHFHSLLIEDIVHPNTVHEEEDSEKVMPLWKRIEDRKARDGAFASDSKEDKQMLQAVAEYLVDSEYKGFWSLMSETVKQEARDMGKGTYRQYWADPMEMSMLRLYNALSSPQLYTARTDNTARLQKLVSKLAQMDKLPKHDTLEELVLLRSAWDAIDVGRAVLLRYKWAAKLLYLVIVLLGIATTTVTVLSDEVNATEPPSATRPASYTNQQLIIFLLSVTTSLAAAVMSFLNPLRRWHQLRDITSGLESSLWEFRTRTGAYQVVPENPSAPAEALKRAVDDCWARVLESADIAETAFGKRYSGSTYRHGQREEASWAAGAARDLEAVAAARDDHYSPLQPDRYLTHRARTMVEFYKLRLPRYARVREAASYFLMAASAAGSIIAFVANPGYVAILTSVTAGVMSWMEFAGVSKKLARYNTSVVKLEGIILWWESLSSVDRASTVKIGELVRSVEQAINAERVSWLSSSQSDKKEGEKEGEVKKEKKGL